MQIGENIVEPAKLDHFFFTENKNTFQELDICVRGICKTRVKSNRKASYNTQTDVSCLALSHLVF